MHINIAVCDDEQAQTDYLSLLAENWAAGGNRTVKIQCFRTIDAFLFAYAGDKAFDIILLDIQFGPARGDRPEAAESRSIAGRPEARDGVELAKLIRRRGSRAQIIFITGYPDFIAEGYEVSALHYLMKPVSPEKLCQVLDRAAALTNPERTVLLPASGGNMRLPESDILYAEAFSHYVTLNIVNGSYNFNIRLNDMEKLLGDGFFRCHRSYIVGMKHARRITRAAVILDNGKEIPLSRRKYDEANQLFIRLF